MESENRKSEKRERDFSLFVPSQTSDGGGGLRVCYRAWLDAKTDIDLMRHPVILDFLFSDALLRL